MSLLDEVLKSFTSSGFKQSLRPLFFVSNILPGSGLNVVLGNQYQLPVQQTVNILWCEFNIFNITNVSPLVTTYFADMNVVELALNHNNIDFLQLSLQPTPSLFPIRCCFNRVNFHPINSLAPSTDFVFSASGKIPIFKKVGPGGVLNLGAIMRTNPTNTYVLSGLMYTSTD